MISIITPAYNHEKYIGRCIESVLAQAYPLWEMIIIDDGSTDGTAAVVRRYNDPRIRYIRQENKGIWRLHETYNLALSMTTGEYVAILEGDDYWPDYKLSTQVEDFNDGKIVLSFGNTQVVNEQGPLEIRPGDVLSADARTNTPVGRAAYHMMDPLLMTFFMPVTVVIRKAALDRIGGFHQPPYLPFVDYPTFILLMFEGETVYHKEVLGYWFRHASSITQNKYSLIIDGVERFVAAFLIEKGSFFTEREKEEIRFKWSDYKAIRWSLLGRLFLHDREWVNARKAFRKGMEHRCTTTRTGLLRLGIISSYLHRDLEFIFRAAGMKSIDELLKSGDPIVSKGMLKQ